MNDSGDLGYKLKVRDSRQVEEEVGSLSSELLDLMQIKGKVAEPGPATGYCGYDTVESKYRSVDHPWSVYGVGDDVLEKGMKNLFSRLPDQGWKIIKYGPNSSKNKDLEIEAVHLKTHTGALIIWMKGYDTHEPLISVDLVSRCFIDSRASSSPTDY
ncbi:hypothetical protein RKE29_05470 [Streptomyces sp. B1866]|uniref:hypothetical protein n=1 Tax=Streptomyces sp. B1866 TaxID=3075431 RepID=UPI002891FB3D|nr:hypothetical protein [Streptomyces sp. B1866]MDT3396096.1 hypothetical protein [Streptomyces sp. B1866]